MGLAIDLHVDLVEVPSPLPETPHGVHALAPDVCGKQGAEPVPPQPHRFMTNVDAALEQQVLDIPQRQRKPHVHEHNEADHLG